MRIRLAMFSIALIGSGVIAACNTTAPTDEEVESAAWGYRGRPTNVFLSEHGIGNREESLAYYAAVLGGSSSATFTLEKWKSQFVGANAPVYKALYKNKMELGFWREMTCTQLIARGVGGCFVTNWGSPDEPGTPGVPNKGTVAMNVSTEGFARFYVFLPDGKLSPSAVLDEEGPKFLPRLCTVCHSGANPKPGEAADLGSVFREFEPELLQSRPGISRIVAEQEWFHLNRVVQQANHAIRPEADGSPFGTNHAREAINDRIDALYIPGGTPDAVPASWAKAGPEAKTLWSKLMVPYCLACHRHNQYDWTDYTNFEFFREETSPGVWPIKNYLPDAPDPDEQVGAMPQAALSFDLLKRDVAAKNAISAWLVGGVSGPPQPGTFCSTPNEIFDRPCGVCGEQQAVCLPAQGGVNRVSQYSQCSGEVPNGCSPGTVENVACGHCGTQVKTCSNTCTFSVGTCNGQPANSCESGDIDTTVAGCTAGTFRTRTCDSECGWGGFSATCVASVETPITIATAVGKIASRAVTLDSSHTINRVSPGTCPTNISSSITPFSYVEVKNTTSKTARVTIYNSRVGSAGPIIDTLLVAYNGRTVPTTDAQRRACVGGIGDFGNTQLTGDNDFASLDGEKAVTIPPNASVQIYVTSYEQFSSSNPSASTGTIKITVRTDSLQ